MSQDIYSLSDKTIRRLNKLAIRRFRDAEKKCRAGLLPFDELTIIREVRQLYADLDADNRKAFLELAGSVYVGTVPHGNVKPDLSWLLALLGEYNPVMKYRYATEVDRKRDYTTEAVIAAVDKSKEFKRGLLYWGRFTANYCDIVAEEAVIKAFKDAGVKQVMWVTERDNKVCDECHDRHGEIYPIDDIPSKPHPGCRCVLQAVD